MSAAQSFLTIGDVAHLAGISASTVRAYLAREQMPPATGKIGRTPYWEPEAIEPWLAERATRDTAAEDRLMQHTGMTRDDVRAWVTKSRAAQGLPPTVQDPAALARMAALVVKRP